MKQSIHNVSDLVSKRRKVASTALAVWKASLSFPRVFFEPSIATGNFYIISLCNPLLRNLFQPYFPAGISPELRSLYYGKKLKVVKSTKAIVPPNALDILKITTSGTLEKIGIAPETSIQSSARISEQINIAPETPVQSSARISEQMGIAPDTPVQNPTTANPFECPMSPATPNYQSIRLPLLESPRRDPSPSRDEELDLNQMDEVKIFFVLRKRKIKREREKHKNIGTLALNLLLHLILLYYFQFSIARLCSSETLIAQSI